MALTLYLPFIYRSGKLNTMNWNGIFRVKDKTWNAHFQAIKNSRAIKNRHAKAFLLVSKLSNSSFLLGGQENQSKILEFNAIDRSLTQKRKLSHIS